ncbi:ATP-binding cassette domain-containing protein [Streptomyces sp. NPDC057695]|uniref:ATP-binding cassette domain-containing protein n=1 Tax=Streptomyces sp. NPDC057695 TaxID=3346217 RepID=UPI00368727F3
MESAPPAISAERLVRRYGSLVAVDEVDLAVRTGEIYGFIGPNGAGKSTLTRVLCTLAAPSSGRATVAGYDVVTQADKVRLSIGAALQEAALDDRQTGAEMLALQGRFYGLSRAATRARVAELTDLIDIGEALGRRVGTYSGGMKRRLDVALALVHRPVVLFLDEPTTGLDPVSRSRVWQEVRRLNTELNMTVFLTTQYLEEADALADRVGIISHGKLVAEGTPEELKRSIGDDVITVQLTGSPEAARRALESIGVVQRIEAAGTTLTVSVSDGPAAITPVAVALSELPDLDVQEISLRRPSLDDVFLSVTGEHLSRPGAAPLDGDAAAESPRETP